MELAPGSPPGTGVMAKVTLAPLNAFAPARLSSVNCPGELLSVNMNWPCENAPFVVVTVIVLPPSSW